MLLLSLASLVIAMIFGSIGGDQLHSDPSNAGALFVLAYVFASMAVVFGARYTRGDS